MLLTLNENVTRFALDKIAPNHPILLRSYYGHGYVVNSKAMPLLKISQDEPDPMGGSFERVRDSRRINGRFWEYAQWKVERLLTEEISDDDAVAQLRQIGEEAVGHGVTSLQMFSSLPIDRFTRLLAKADPPIRVYARPFSIACSQSRDASELRQLASLKPDHPRVTVGGIKWILDGTPFERGAALRQPYHDKPDARGALNFPEREIVSIVKESLEAGADVAATRGATSRLRPILMTTFAMIAGMIRVALGAEQLAPLGRAVIGGLAASTVATLVVLPALFALVQRRAGVVSPPLDPDDAMSRHHSGEVA